MAENDERVKKTQAIAKKLNAAGWGALFIWIGIAFLANLGWGVGLIGVGVLVLGGEAAQRYFSLHMDWFWLMMGIIFVVWGVSGVLGIQLGGILWPIVSIVVGLTILITGFRPHPRH